MKTESKFWWKFETYWWILIFLEKKVISSEITGRKQLICICNVEYVMSACLPAIGRRLTECGVRFADSILKTAATKMAHYRDQLVKRYIAAKSATIVSLVTIANYDHIPLEDGKCFGLCIKLKFCF